MTEKRFTIKEFSTLDVMSSLDTICDYGIELPSSTACDLLNKLYEENKKLKFKNGELLYQIGEIGKNNKTCRECECFIPENKYCYMWDMEVKADDVVVACDQRKIKNTNEMINNG